MCIHCLYVGFYKLSKYGGNELPGYGQFSRWSVINLVLFCSSNYYCEKRLEIPKLFFYRVNLVKQKPRKTKFQHYRQYPHQDIAKIAYTVTFAIKSPVQVIKGHLRRKRI